MSTSQTTISYQAKIVSALNNLFRSTDLHEARHNVGKHLSVAFFWDSVADYAKKQADRAWKSLEEANIIEDDEGRRKLDTGEHILAESPHFVCRAVVTKAVRRFNVQELAKILKKDYKIPEPTTVQLCEKAKKETVPQVRLAVEEKGV